MASEKTPLTPGYSVVINRKVGSSNTPIYPFTKTANVKDAVGNTLDEIIAGLATSAYVDSKNYVPTNEAEASNVRFLRNDNTWATIQDGTTTQKGIVQLSDSVNADDSTTAATSKAVKTLSDAISNLANGSSSTYVKKSQLGVATAVVGDETVVGVATLNEDGFIPASQLPSYVDDVIEVEMTADYSSAKGKDGQPIVPEVSKIYVDCVGDAPSNNAFRWSGSTYVEISKSLALGETSSTAFDGQRGLAAYNHSIALHARVDATKVEASETNGYIKVWATGADAPAEVLVYTHPSVDGATATNPHGTTAADVGLGKVENKTSEEIRAELTSKNVTDALGFTPQNVDTLATTENNGLMSAAQVKKMNNMLEASVSADEPTFEGEGIWFQIIGE